MLGVNALRGDKKVTKHFFGLIYVRPLGLVKIARGEIRTLDQALKRRVLYR